jgi:transcriptional regulator with XRE-family HTH domain
VSEPNYFHRLEEALHRQRKSKGALAAYLGVALSTVSRWRVAVPKAETVQKTADWLGVDAKWLLTGEESENAESAGNVKDLPEGEVKKEKLEARLDTLEKILTEFPEVARLLQSSRLDRAEVAAREFFGSARHLATQSRLAAEEVTSDGLALELKFTAQEVENRLEEVRDWMNTLISLQREIQ